METNHNYTNKLINERSPYLLQHAHNPVDWFAWGDEAFKKAKDENKPVFLSIGYSTCHWCHVMEKDVFEDVEVAKLMNKVFVSIKVDREERPDIDNIYMTVCQMFTGSGGWPLSVILTPDKLPFYAATYIPKYSKYGRPGMIELIPMIQDTWKNKRNEINHTGESVFMDLNRILRPEAATDSIDMTILNSAFEALKKIFDMEHGGFGTRPKFPTPQNLLFLLRYWKRTGSKEALTMVNKTLTEIRKGGIYDQIGYGFHRYATDENWIVPHFEKMLYDQAQLVLAYVEAFQATGDQLFKTTACQILTYVLRDMQNDGGGFYSAEDADSEGEEGKFYVWDYKELKSVLDEKDLNILKEYFSIIEQGNYNDESNGRPTGKNILHITGPQQFLVQNSSQYDKFNNICKKLFKIREKRIHPFKDKKILTDWNGLMLAALAKAARIFNDKYLIEAAIKTASFIQKNMYDKSGMLHHLYINEKADVPAMLDDYAFLTWGLLELYETTFEVSYIKHAISLTDKMISYFEDHKFGGFFLTADTSETVLVRHKTYSDSSIPSGNSVALMNLIRLAKITANDRYLKTSDALVQSVLNALKKYPQQLVIMLSAIDFLYGESNEIIIAGYLETDKTQSIIKVLRSEYIPNKVVVLISKSNIKKILDIADFYKNFRIIDDKTTVYVCKNYNCKAPVYAASDMLKLL